MAKHPQPLAPKALTDNGWTFKEWCACKITRKAIFTNPEYPDLEVWLWTKAYKFQVKRGRSIVVNWTRNGGMNEVLKGLTK